MTLLALRGSPLHRPMPHPIPSSMTARLSGALRALGATALFLLAGCAVLEPEPLAGERRELSRARTLWQRQALASYRYEYAPRCAECATTYARPVLLTVDKGVVVEAEYVDTNQPVGINPQLYGTVDSLFALVQRAYDQHAYAVNVRYDAERGYPYDVWIDWRADLADEEHGFAITRLAPYVPTVTAFSR